MKKIVFAALLFIVPFYLIINTNEKSIYDPLPDATLDDTWERIKVQVYELGKHKNRPIFKYTGPILFKLSNADEKDSLAFENVLNELKVLLPFQEINYFSDYTGVDFEDKDYAANEQKIGVNNVIKKDTLINGYSFHYLKAYTIKFHFYHQKNHELLNNTVQIHDGKTFGHFNSVTESALTKDISGYLDSTTLFNFGTNTSVDVRSKILKNLIFKILSANSFHISNDYYLNKIDSSDEQVLQRFYSPNFEEEFESYMYKTYPWRYAANFLNKEKTKILTIWLCMVVGLVLGLLGFSIFYKRKYKIRYFKYAVPLIAITLSILNVFLIYAFITNSIDIQTRGDVFGVYIVFITIASIAALFLMVFDKFIIKKEMNFTLQFVLKSSYTFLVFMAPIAIVFIIEDYNKKYAYHNFVERLSPLISTAFILTFGRALLLYLDHFSENLIKEKDLELSQLKEVNAQAEVKLLQSQINPHFLYNSLNSIASLAPIDALKTQKMAHSLSDLFKYSINRKGENTSTIKDEIEMVKTYLEIEKIRFESHLQFTIAVDPELQNHKIPLFLIQPLVENAIIHGVSKNVEVGKIKIKVEQKEDEIHISVSDNGPDFPDGLLSGHGLQTVYDLLRLNYEDKATLNWTNTPQKRITITIPETV